jgi:hypothetical protein
MTVEDKTAMSKNNLSKEFSIGSTDNREVEQSSIDKQRYIRGRRSVH